MASSPMTERPSVSAAELPRVLPIFPLWGVLLLPTARLPLNVFEDRYLAMVRDALDGNGMIGMIQPREPEKAEPGDRPPVFGTGCLGRITRHEETEDGRILVTLVGQCRFDVVEELPLERGYRRVVANYGPYVDTDIADDDDVHLDRGRLMMALRGYFATQGIKADWEAIEETPDGRLVTALAMICPFEASEKQALLEAPDTDERGRVMIALMEMALAGGGGEDGPGVQH